RLEVGAPGFEPGTSCSQSRRDTRLRYAPRAFECIRASTRNQLLPVAAKRVATWQYTASIGTIHTGLRLRTTTDEPTTPGTRARDDSHALSLLASPRRTFGQVLLR